MVAVGEGDPGVVVATLRQALEALSRLSNERASLEEALKVRRCFARGSVCTCDPCAALFNCLSSQGQCDVIEWCTAGAHRGGQNGGSRR